MVCYRWFYPVGCQWLLSWLLITFGTVVCYNVSNEQLHTIKLGHGTVKLTWLIDWHKREVLFNMENVFQGGKFQTFALGFSQRGELGRTDLCVFVSVNGLYQQIHDAYTSPDFSQLFLDTAQHCELLRMHEGSVAFRRSFDTCDPQDIPFHAGTMYLVWWRTHHLVDVSPTGTWMHNASQQNQGVVPVQLLRADTIRVPEKTHELKRVDVRLERVPVPGDETTYWCKIQPVEPWLLATKHHIVQFEPLIDGESLVHHMEVFQCVTDAHVEIAAYNGYCKDMPASGHLCSKVMALWAMGAGTFTYPREAGLPIGGPGFNPFIRLEVHFNNPLLKVGHIDSSGMRINVVSKLRRFDAAIMELGLEYTDKMAIPPGQIAFPLSGYCIAECTQVGLPATGVVVFGSQLHTHLRGVRVLTRHFRGRTELPTLNRDDFFSHHYQEIRQLRYKPLVLPGDALVTTCYYDTRGYETATLGGFSISDEMCVNYIHYYPATQLELCKSSISERALYDYFTNTQKVEKQSQVHAEGARSDNYRSIQWTPARVAELLEVYHTEPLSMQCNRSDGLRFDGHDWEDAPITPIPLPAPQHSHHCPPVRSTLSWFKPLNEGKCDSYGECIYADTKLKE